MNINNFQATAIIGLTFIITATFMLSLKKKIQRTYIYSFFLIGGVFLIIYSFYIKDPIFIILQIAYITIVIYNITKLYSRPGK